MNNTRVRQNIQEAEKESPALGNTTTYASFSPRKKKYKLLEKVKRIFINSGERMRVLNCMKLMSGSIVQVKHNGEHAYYSGINACGSIWTCPVCASRITEERRKELSLALSSSGFVPVMVTVTLQHERKDKLSELLEALTESLRSLKSGRWWKTFREKYKVIAHVSSLEFTFSKHHGWHPHKHWLLFLDVKESEIDEVALQKALTRRYKKLLEKRGRYASESYGIDVKIGNEGAGAYVAKWGMSEEMTKSNIKAGNNESYSPFQLVELASSGQKFAELAFLEYARATFGKRQLTYSRNGREALGLGKEKTDSELVNEEAPEDEIIISLERQVWKVILKYTLQAEILELAESGGAEAVKEFINNIDFET